MCAGCTIATSTRSPARRSRPVLGPGVVRGTGTLPFINGTTAPRPLELVKGETYRLRFIHITANDAQQVTLEGPGEIEWRALARDGADYAPELATRHPPATRPAPARHSISNSCRGRPTTTC